MSSKSHFAMFMKQNLEEISKHPYTWDLKNDSTTVILDLFFGDVYRGEICILK